MGGEDGFDVVGVDGVDARDAEEPLFESVAGTADECVEVLQYAALFGGLERAHDQIEAQRPV